MCICAGRIYNQTSQGRTKKVHKHVVVNSAAVCASPPACSVAVHICVSLVFAALGGRANFAYNEDGTSEVRMDKSSKDLLN